MARDTDDLKSRVQKLLNQAADREGTPEGDTFYEKAFDLMARYGFDESLDDWGRLELLLKQQFLNYHLNYHKFL